MPVTGVACGRAAKAPQIEVIHLNTTPDPKSDFSSYITIINNLSVPIYLVKATISGQGSWSPQSTPPAVIDANSTVNFALSEEANQGSRGEVWYSVADPPQNGTTFDFKFGCPYKENNFATAEVNAAAGDCNYALPFSAYAGDDSSNPQFCGCPNRGHALYVSYTVAYRILSVRCADGENTPVLDVNGMPVAAGDPIWAPGSQSYSDGKGGSTNPAVFPFPPSDTAPAQLLVRMTNDAATMQGFQLCARNAGGGLVLQSTPVAKGSASTLVVTVNAPQGSDSVGIVSLVGAVAWYLGNQKNPIANTAPLEVYWLFGMPLPMWTLGVWVQPLRDIFAILPATDMNSMNACVTDIVKNCFSGFANKKYEKTYALGYNYLAPSATGKGQAFLLYNYYNDIKNPSTGGNTADCTDQRSLVMVMLGAVGIPSGMYSLTITPTTSLAQLVPVSTDPNDQVQLLPGISVYPGTQSPGDIEWYGHDIASYENSEGSDVPLDATLGPALGTQTMSGYLKTNFGSAQVTVDGGPGPATCDIAYVVCTPYPASEGV